ncbi:MAG: hypothetical protein KAI18_01915 [Candidatus Aenigmarchaeota archaeon]|nr:hypothetical protein [Candidatus Aenigmarchaeota archaeon]
MSPHIIPKSVEPTTVTEMYEDFLENPSKYINQETPSGIKGVKYFWITRSLVSMFEKTTDKRYDFNINLDPAVIYYDSKDDFINFIGKALNLVNHMPETEVPFKYVEDMGSFNFKQKDGKDDLRTYHLTPLIIKGNNMDDYILYFQNNEGWDDKLPNTMINVYNLDGAKLVDAMLTLWFAVNDE